MGCQKEGKLLCQDCKAILDISEYNYCLCNKNPLRLPEDLEYMKRMPSIQWSLWASKVLQEKLQEITEIRGIAAKSKATDEDVEELTDEINEAIWKRQSKYAK